MSGIDDDELRAMLEARADRASIDPVTIFAEGRRRALEPRRSGSRLGSGGVAAPLVGLAVVVVVAVLVALPLVSRPVAAPTPSVPGLATTPLPSGTVARPSQTPRPAGYPITAAELDPAMGDTTGFVELTIVFKGAFVADPTPCPPGNVCGLRVEGISRPHTIVAPQGEELPALPASGRIEGTFAIHFTDRILDDGRLVFEDLGPIVTGPDGPTWPVGVSAAGGNDLATGLVAASGWIVRTPVHPCPATPMCDATEDYLTATAYQPVQLDGSVVGPPVESSIWLGTGAYDAWVPDPKNLGTGVEPRPVSLMVRLVPPACAMPSGVDGLILCPSPTTHRWEVVGRLDPPPFAQPVPPPEPTRLPTPQGSLAPAAAERQPGGFPTTINGTPVNVGIDALARWSGATDNGPFLVGGWFDSHLLQSCSPPVGQAGLDPLEARGCSAYPVDGLPGSPIYRDGFAMPDGNGPIVLRVHTRDPGATRCTPGGRAFCLERTIVEGVVWFGDVGTVAAPIGPAVARSTATSVFVTEWRDMAGGGQMAVNEDVFTVPITCPAPWPTFLFSIHGDPRYGMVAVFPDTATRERFEASTDPVVGAKCLDLAIERPAPARWVGHENMLVLLFADDAFATRLADVLANPGRPQKALSMTEPAFDRTLGTATDYLLARASGELDHAWGQRLVDPVHEDGYPTWYADVLRRQAADALTGRIEVLDEAPTEARVGPAIWSLLHRAGVTGSHIVRVTYDHATDPALAREDFLVIHMPASEFHDWQLIRIDSP
jgi:hypothetical protein